MTFGLSDTSKNYTFAPPLHIQYQQIIYYEKIYFNIYNDDRHALYPGARGQYWSMDHCDQNKRYMVK